MKERSRRRCWILRAGLLTMLATLPGCNGSDEGPPRVAVDGQVTFRGQAVEKGSIVFIPTGETQGPKTGTVIEAGRYRLAKDRGPVIGKLRVEVRAEQELDYDITEPTETVKHIGEPMPRSEIPPEFNDRSTLFIETTPDGDNSFDFHLPAKP
ncbi:MAG: hypothetical protein O3C40_16620 [Planctomycetota bacterium]|nr:hypothetical protein [Planctomycetota bacterium]